MPCNGRGGPFKPEMLDEDELMMTDVMWLLEPDSRRNGMMSMMESPNSIIHEPGTEFNNLRSRGFAAGRNATPEDAGDNRPRGQDVGHPG